METNGRRTAGHDGRAAIVDRHLVADAPSDVWSTYPIDFAKSVWYNIIRMKYATHKNELKRTACLTRQTSTEDWRKVGYRAGFKRCPNCEAFAVMHLHDDVHRVDEQGVPYTLHCYECGWKDSWEGYDVERVAKPRKFLSLGRVLEALKERQ